MSVSGALKLAVLLPFSVVFLVFLAASADLIGEGQAQWVAMSVVVLSLWASLNIKCPRCAQMAGITWYGTSPFNRRCQRCGLDLSKVRWRGDRPHDTDVASDGLTRYESGASAPPEMTKSLILILVGSFAAILSAMVLLTQRRLYVQVALTTIVATSVLTIVLWRWRQR